MFSSEKAGDRRGEDVAPVNPAWIIRLESKVFL